MGEAHPADRPKTIAAAIAAAAIGVLMYNTLPLFLGQLQEGHGLTSSQTGLIGTAFFFGFNIAGLSAVLWIRRLAWRWTALATVPVIVATLLLSIVSDGFAELAALGALCGFASGVIYTIGSVIVGDTSNPERWYGVKVALESLAGTVLLLALPVTLIAWAGFGGTPWGMALLTIALLPLVLMLPANWSKPRYGEGASDADPHGGSTDIAALACAVMALLMVFAGASAIWAFAERMGKLSGFSDESVGALLGITLFSGIAGSLGVAAFGARLRGALPFLATIGLILGALALLSVKGSFALYTLGNCLYMIGWSAATPLASAEIARLDGDGRFTSLLVPAIGVGSMIGPGVAGWLLDVSGVFSVLGFAASSIAIAGGLLLVADLRSRRWGQKELAL